MKTAMYESVWESANPFRSWIERMTVKMLNQMMPMMSPPIARAPIELRRGASFRINSVMGAPSGYAPGGLSGAARGLDDEVTDPGPGQGCGDPDDPDPVGSE